MSRTITISDFKLGQRRDANLVVERLQSLRTLRNYRLTYSGDGAKLKIRRGYTRWNGTVMAAPATQLFWFKDLEGNEHLLGIIDSNSVTGLWRTIEETGAHITLTTETCTARRPIVQVGNRTFFGTDGSGSDIGFRWVDNTSIGAGVSYRVGIVRPSPATIVATATASGHIAVTDSARVMTVTAQRKLAIQYDVGASDEIVTAIFVRVQRLNTTSNDSSWTCRIRTDNASEPSATLVDDKAISIPISVPTFSVAATGDYKRFVFYGDVTLSANTTYWFEFEGDDDYYENYNSGTYEARIRLEGVSPTHDFGPLQVFDNAGGGWSDTPSGKEAVFYLSGIDPDQAYGYVLTYVNSTYGIESRPSEEERRTITDAQDFTVNHNATADNQVDKVRIYRREMTGIEDAEVDISDKFKFVAEVDESSAYIDNRATISLGAELQTQDHYRFDETDDENQNARDVALLPFVAVYWKGRIIFAEENSNILHFSKRLEQDGRTGQVGDEAVDFYPLSNRQEMPIASDIIGLKVLANDQLAVYFKNEVIWVIRGMNEVLNPPSDISRYEVLDTVGLFAPASLQTYKERHVYLSSEGVYVFNGTANPQHASNVIQSIFDAIEAANLDGSIIAVYGNEIWVLVDSDNDDVLDKFYILDLQQPEAPWREYDYGTTLNDVVVRKTGGTFRSLFVADAESNYVLELEDGTDDNGAAIEAVVETHDIEVSGEIAIEDVALQGLYPGSPPQYSGVLINHIGDERAFTINPSNSEDIRGHHTGVRLRSTGRIRTRITQRSLDEDELRSIAVRYQI